MRLLSAIVRWVTICLLWVWAILKLAHELFGIGEMLDHPERVRNLGTRALVWLFSTPWWVPSGLALLAILLLFVPRTSTDTKSKPPSTQKKEKPAASILLSYTYRTKSFTYYEKENVRSVGLGSTYVPESDPIQLIKIEFEKPIGEYDIAMKNSAGPNGARMEVKETAPESAVFSLFLLYQDQDITLSFFKKRATKGIAAKRDVSG
jgi:hypothetical protein